MGIVGHQATVNFFQQRFGFTSKQTLALMGGRQSMGLDWRSPAAARLLRCGSPALHELRSSQRGVPVAQACTRWATPSAATRALPAPGATSASRSPTATTTI